MTNRLSLLSRNAAILGALLLLSHFVGASPCCANHEGVMRYERQEHTAVCNDGAIDKACSGTTHPTTQKSTAVLHFKKPPDRGQILLPGEKAPPTTLKDSQASTSNSN